MVNKLATTILGFDPIGDRLALFLATLAILGQKFVLKRTRLGNFIREGFLGAIFYAPGLIFIF